MTTPARAEAPTSYDRDEIGDGEPDHKFALMINPLDVALGVYGGEADFVVGTHGLAGLGRSTA